MAKTQTQVLFYAKPQVISADGCFAISFFRPTGANAVQVSGIPIEAGQTLTIEQNVGDVDCSKYDVVFYGGGGGDELYVIKIMPIG